MKSKLVSSSNHVWMWEMAHEEAWVLKNWWFLIVVLEKTLGQKEIKWVNPKRNQPWISLERLMLKLKLQYFGHLIRRADSLETSLILGMIEGRWRRGWQRRRWLDSITDSGHEFEQTLGDVEGLRSLVCSMGSWRVRYKLATEQQQNFSLTA